MLSVECDKVCPYAQQRIEKKKCFFFSSNKHGIFFFFFLFDGVFVCRWCRKYVSWFIRISILSCEWNSTPEDDRPPIEEKGTSWWSARPSSPLIPIGQKHDGRTPLRNTKLLRIVAHFYFFIFPSLVSLSSFRAVKRRATLALTSIVLYIMLTVKVLFPLLLYHLIGWTILYT